MNTDRFQTVVNIMNNVCNEINKSSENNLEYVILQGLEQNDPYLCDPFIIYKIANFYNYNWLGNIDFMHIPNFTQVEYNSKNFPIIIAREKKSKEIVGISTLKYEENKEKVDDPYYPIPHEKYFSITGILTKINNPHKGVGKKIYEIALKGHYYFNKLYKDTSIMCVIDCRNKNSINAFNSAAETLNQEIEENISAKVAGYYTLTNDSNEMLEAPTLVLKVDESREKNKDRNIIEFNHRRGESLFKSLLKTLKNELTNVSEPIISIDKEEGLVNYYHVRNYNTLPRIISNGTENGNDRKVEKDPKEIAMCRIRTFKR